MYVGIFILALILLIVIYGTSVYNHLVKLRTLVQEAWSGMDVMLKKRHDLIPNLVETVKGYATHERETLQNVIDARSRAADVSDVAQRQAAENSLTAALTHLFAVAENYPDLKANTAFLQLQEQLSVLEGDIEKSRRYYNGTVREQNILVEMFPSNVVARMFGFTKSAFFEQISPQEREVPKVSF